MTKQSEGWMQGRDRHVRVYLTDEEHAVVRQAAALTDKSVSRFSVEAVVETARAVIRDRSPPPTPPRGVEEVLDTHFPQRRKPARKKK